MARKRYPTDLSDAEWDIVSPLIPHEKPGGRPREVDLREVMNALFYLLRTGCSWEMLPHDFPPHQTVYWYFSEWKRDGTWEEINAALRTKLRQAAGREAEPSAAIIDSQSAKTTETPGERGYDAGKKVKGRKHHLIVDTLGLVLMAVVHAANIQDRDGAKWVLERIKGQFARLQLIEADGGYAGKLVDWVKQTCGWVLEIVKRNAEVKGFQLLPHRWIVERTFGWLGRYRRLSKDDEGLPETSEAMIYATRPPIMLRHLGRARSQRFQAQPAAA